METVLLRPMTFSITQIERCMRPSVKVAIGASSSRTRARDPLAKNSFSDDFCSPPQRRRRRIDLEVVVVDFRYEIRRTTLARARLELTISLFLNLDSSPAPLLLRESFGPNAAATRPAVR